MDNNCPLNYLIIIRYFEERNDFPKIFVFNQVFLELESSPYPVCTVIIAFIMAVSDKGNYTFVVKDSLCFAEGIQGMSRRNLLYNWSAYIKKKEKISERLGSYMSLLRFHGIKRLKLNCST